MRNNIGSIFFLVFVLFFASCRTLSDSQISTIKLYASANAAAAKGVIETRTTLNSLQNEMQALNKSTLWDPDQKASKHLEDYIRIISERDSILILFQEAFTTLEKYSELLLAVLDEEYGKELSDKTEKMADHADSLISSINTLANTEFKIGLGFWIKKFFDTGAKKVLKRKRYSIMKSGIVEGFNPMDSIYNFYTGIAYKNDLSEWHDLQTSIPREFDKLAETILNDSSGTFTALTFYKELQPVYQKIQAKNIKLSAHISNTAELIKALQPVYKSLKDSFANDKGESVSIELISKLKSALKKYKVSNQHLNL